jgi:hypothetical protein
MPEQHHALMGGRGSPVSASHAALKSAPSRCCTRAMTSPPLPQPRQCHSCLPRWTAKAVGAAAFRTWPDQFLAVSFQRNTAARDLAFDRHGLRPADPFVGGGAGVGHDSPSSVARLARRMSRTGSSGGSLSAAGGTGSSGGGGAAAAGGALSPVISPRGISSPQQVQPGRVKPGLVGGHRQPRQRK